MPSEQQNTSSGNLTPPFDDPEALIHARNAERRRLAKISKKSSSDQTAPEPTLPSSSAKPTMPSELPSPFLSPTQPTELPHTPGAFSNTGGSTPKDGPSTGSPSLPTVPRTNGQSTDELRTDRHSRPTGGPLLTAWLNLNRCYSASAANLLAFALPALCFVAYITRARMLRTMMNFQCEVVLEFEMAEALTFGLTAELKMKVHDFQFLLVSPFNYYFD
ncbi:hypothetical protein VP01_6673g1 [Puccinia sorghi]|uniref:Uncharacterized protein n=1 Tax=Puccinia sorghi TaxID=27349 RepID=A0A0L6UEV7_9BASI|nr:hypothetical protein VP01_6673g1 [Puccinia sorghi]